MTFFERPHTKHAVLHGGRCRCQVCWSYRRQARAQVALDKIAKAEKRGAA